MKTVTTIIDGHEMEVPEHLVAVEFKSSLINDIPRTYDEIKRMKESHDDLMKALLQIAMYDPTKLDAATLGNIARAALRKAGAI